MSIPDIEKTFYTPNRSRFTDRPGIIYDLNKWLLLKTKIFIHVIRFIKRKISIYVHGPNSLPHKGRGIRVVLRI